LHPTDAAVGDRLSQRAPHRVVAELEVDEVHHAAVPRLLAQRLRRRRVRPERLVAQDGVTAPECETDVARVQEGRRVDGDEVDVAPRAELVHRVLVARAHDVDDLAPVGPGERRRDAALAEPATDQPDRHHYSPVITSGSVRVGSTARWKRARKKWPSGPIPSAKTSVPTPTSPPSTQPTASALSSSPMRTSHSG